MSLRWPIVAAVAMVLVVTGLADANPPLLNKRVLVKVDAAPNAWAAGQLAGKLLDRLSRDGSLRVTVVDPEAEGQPPFPKADRDLDSLIGWGQEMGGRYLLLVDVHRKDLCRRKSWSLPLIFHRWETVGVIEGEVRLIDMARSRLVVAKPFELERKAKGAFQATMDDDAGDPDLHLSAPEKLAFFAYLEDQLAEHLLRETKLLRMSSP
ncbi:MAG: hypothetical protein ABIE70_12415 [bacterium]